LNRDKILASSVHHVRAGSPPFRVRSAGRASTVAGTHSCFLIPFTSCSLYQKDRCACHPAHRPPPDCTRIVASPRPIRTVANGGTDSILSKMGRFVKARFHGLVTVSQRTSCQSRQPPFARIRRLVTVSSSQYVKARSPFPRFGDGASENILSKLSISSGQNSPFEDGTGRARWPFGQIGAAVAGAQRTRRITPDFV
jgi:hypothetical protein